MKLFHELMTKIVNTTSDSVRSDAKAEFVEDTVVQGIECFHGNPAAEVLRGERIGSGHVNRLHSVGHHQPKQKSSLFNTFKISIASYTNFIVWSDNESIDFKRSYQ